MRPHRLRGIQKREAENAIHELHNAVEQGKIDAVQWLLHHGADQSVVNVFGMSPKDLAIVLEEWQVVELLARDAE